jgi:hypothetical protein
MQKAAIWYSGTSPRVNPSTSAATSAGAIGFPSRFAWMIS